MKVPSVYLKQPGKKKKSPSFTICGIEKARKVKHKLLFLAFIFFFSENVDR